MPDVPQSRLGPGKYTVADMPSEPELDDALTTGNIIEVTVSVNRGGSWVRRAVHLRLINVEGVETMARAFTAYTIQDGIELGSATLTVKPYGGSITGDLQILSSST